MNKEEIKLWNYHSEDEHQPTTMIAYIPEHKLSDSAVIILPGGAYLGLAEHEGEEYAQFLNRNGVCAFVCNYRVSPHRFPTELLDVRRAIRYVRYYAEKYNINKKKIAVMGSSAGGHLAALVSTYFYNIDGEGVDDIDYEDFIPNAQILCYPVIKMSVDSKEAHVGSCLNLLGVEQLSIARALSPENIVSDRTPKCFMWHTLADNIVPVGNSLDYAKALEDKGISCELHIFPDGHHGLGLSDNGDCISKHVAQWNDLLLSWLKYCDL